MHPDYDDKGNWYEWHYAEKIGKYAQIERDFEKEMRKKPLPPVVPTEMKECAECNEVKAHDENDFVCRQCRAK